MNLLIMMYTGLSKPYTPNYLNKKELINEFIILEVTTLYVLFSDFCFNFNTSYNIGGWSYIGLFSFLIIFNLGYLLV